VLRASARGDLRPTVEGCGSIRIGGSVDLEVHGGAGELHRRVVLVVADRRCIEVAGIRTAYEGASTAAVNQQVGQTRWTSAADGSTRAFASSRLIVASDKSAS